MPYYEIPINPPHYKFDEQRMTRDSFIILVFSPEYRPLVYTRATQQDVETLIEELKRWPGYRSSYVAYNYRGHVVAHGRLPWRKHMATYHTS